MDVGGLGYGVRMQEEKHQQNQTLSKVHGVPRLNHPREVIYENRGNLIHCYSSRGYESKLFVLWICPLVVILLIESGT